MEALEGVEVLAIAEAFAGDKLLADVLALADATGLGDAVDLAEANVLAVATGFGLTDAGFLTAPACVATDFDTLVAFVAMRSLH